MSKWRAENGLFSRIYENATLMAHCDTPEQATRICALLNEREQFATALDRIYSMAAAQMAEPAGPRDVLTLMHIATLIEEMREPALAASEPSTPAK